MPASGLNMTDREVMSIFGKNLRTLCRGEPSITGLCQKLNINRAQFNRYLSGESSPRPLILQRICEYFDVDARILLQPLESLKLHDGARARDYVGDVLRHSLEPVAHSVIADGLYAEWKLSLHNPGLVRFHVLHVRSEDGLRKTRVKSLDHVRPDISGLRRAKRKVSNWGFIFKQGAGFAQFDSTVDSDIITMTSFSAGYGVNPRIFTGIKLSGTRFVPFLSHCATACILEPLPSDCPGLLQAVRQPLDRPVASAPRHIGRILLEIAQTGFVSPANPLWQDSVA